MRFSVDLDRVATQVRAKPFLTIFSLLVVMLALETVLAREMTMGQHTASRRLDCSVFCRKTGFSGYVGGCQCGFTLFANKRSHLHSRLFQSPSSAKLIYPENSFVNDDESTEELETRPNAKERQVALGTR